MCFTDYIISIYKHWFSFSCCMLVSNVLYILYYIHAQALIHQIIHMRGWMQWTAGLIKCISCIYSSIKHMSSFNSVQFKLSWSVSHWSSECLILFCTHTVWLYTGITTTLYKTFIPNPQKLNSLQIRILWTEPSWTSLVMQWHHSLLETIFYKIP